SDQDRARAPSASITAPFTQLLCPSSTRLLPLAKSHSRSVASKDQVSALTPSGNTIARQTPQSRLCPTSARLFPLARSHSRSVPSEDHDRARAPSASITAPFTQLL